ncbi:carbamoyltransferase HypF [Candidatus Amarolinea aalborgensis]|uniref:carbamoyltransferase HypF n=1 Tax=Candidatus Amarolinea aalborgensis TaxID=2249329 RepID=UPI003BF95226
MLAERHPTPDRAQQPDMAAAASAQPGDVAAGRLRVEIHGAVQGVGFRPFVYRLATELQLCGWVLNDTRGVFIEVEGPGDRLHAFLQRLPAERPPLAVIHALTSSWLPTNGDSGFEIRHSDALGAKTALILPDMSTCPDCLAEVFAPHDRRYTYPFTNCTNCGPRFTIIEALPYDRPHTTMRRFIMCPSCQAEYEDPRSRRFHAQPNACPVCGPQLALWRCATGSAEINLAAKAASAPAPAIVTLATGHDALCAAAEALAADQIVAVKGLGGFHLMVDARDAAAVARLRERKRRPTKPLALMVRNLAQARALCEVSPEAEGLLTAPEAPIVLLPRRPETGVAEGVAPGHPTLGLMLPYTPLHHLLLTAVEFPLVATSGNLSDEPICIDEREAVERLGSVADLFLVHDRPISRHADDSVAWMVDGQAQLLRRARGFAPLPVLVKHELPVILGVGAHLKNTVALSIGRQVFISQHIGDLETPQAMDAFERVIADFLRLYEAEPVVIAHDLHPDYLSTQWARAHGGRLCAVQHHHAHLAACLAENQVDGPALGVTWDGAGYGADGTIWGGEFLLGNAAGFTRMASLRPFRLPGGEAAIREPARVALALLWELYGDAAFEMDDLAPLQAFRPGERRLLRQMLQRGLHAPITTSAGRLFDGIAALIGLRSRVSYEGEAALALEFAANPNVHDAYPIRLTTVSAHYRDAELPSSLIPDRPIQQIDWSPTLEAILADLRRGTDRGIIAARFHQALVGAIVTVAEHVGTNRVALTGGCFQNRLLTERTAPALRRAGFEVLRHRQTPANDGGISLGQVAVAAAQLTKTSAA